MPSTTKMLINATHPEELRVALVEGQKLLDLDIETKERLQQKGDIYLGEVSRVEPSLNAAFISYGAKRHGFLSLKEIAPNYYSKPRENNTPFTINDAVSVGQKVLVQVDKEERGTKGAALTTYISLAGCYLVLMPNNPGGGGVSRRIEGDERDEMRETLAMLNVPSDMGLIVRTAGVGRSPEELKWDFDVLCKQWGAIQRAADEGKAPLLIHQEANAVIRGIRDYLKDDIEEILIDKQEVYDEAQKYISILRPDFVERVKLYNDPIPLFNRFQVEGQIEKAFSRTVQLPSGGAIVIDPTEALVSIDVNSYKSTSSENIEETAYHTNLEAADEISRQLKIRDMGGLIVIDFIDMLPAHHRRDVENRLRDACRRDRARIQVGRISRFGLLEMSRQRLRPSLKEHQTACPRCDGQGFIRSVETLGLSLLRVIEEESLKAQTAQVRIQVPPEMATYLLNEKRTSITQIEERQKVTVTVIVNPYLLLPNYNIDRQRPDQFSGYQSAESSYKLVETPDIEMPKVSTPNQEKAALPVIKSLPVSQAPRKDNGLIQKVWSSIFGCGDEKKEEDNTEKVNSSTGNDAYQGRSRGGNYRGTRSQQNRNGSRTNGRRQGNRGRGGNYNNHTERGRSGNQNAERNRDGNYNAKERDDKKHNDTDAERGNRQYNNDNEHGVEGRGNNRRNNRSRGGRGRRDRNQNRYGATDTLNENFNQNTSSQPSFPSDFNNTANTEEANRDIKKQRGGTRNPYRLQQQRRRRPNQSPENTRNFNQSEKGWSERNNYTSFPEDKQPTSFENANFPSDYQTFSRPVDNFVPPPYEENFSAQQTSNQNQPNTTQSASGSGQTTGNFAQSNKAQDKLPLQKTPIQNPPTQPVTTNTTQSSNQAKPTTLVGAKEQTSGDD